MREPARAIQSSHARSLASGAPRSHERSEEAEVVHAASLASKDGSSSPLATSNLCCLASSACDGQRTVADVSRTCRGRTCRGRVADVSVWWSRVVWNLLPREHSGASSSARGVGVLSI